jgi:hypothetical protein
LIAALLRHGDRGGDRDAGLNGAGCISSGGQAVDAHSQPIMAGRFKISNVANTTD